MLRFEDWKKDAVRELERVDRFLGLKCSRERLVAAAKASDVDILKRLEQSMVQSDPTALQLNRRGQAHEWREVWQDEWNDVFDRRWELVFSMLVYELPERFTSSPPATIDVERVLQWWTPTYTAPDTQLRPMLVGILDRH